MRPNHLCCGEVLGLPALGMTGIHLINRVGGFLG
jgi:hypothetical protein